MIQIQFDFRFKHSAALIKAIMIRITNWKSGLEDANEGFLKHKGNASAHTKINKVNTLYSNGESVEGLLSNHNAIRVMKQ